MTDTNTAEEFDPFKGESGLKDDFDGVITDAWFATQENYGTGVLLHLKVVADDGEEVENRYPVGPDWATYDGGDTVQHPKDPEGRTKGFNKNTKYFRLIERAMELENVEATLRARSAELNNQGPKAAALWKGLKFHWVAESKDVKFTNKEGEKIERQSTIVLPSAFLGAGIAPAAVAGGGDLPGPSVGPSGPSAASPGTTMPAAAVNADIPAGLLTSLKIAAKQAGDYSAFADAALEIDGVVGNDAAMGLLSDESFYVANH